MYVLDVFSCRIDGERPPAITRLLENHNDISNNSYMTHYINHDDEEFINDLNDFLKSDIAGLKDGDTVLLLFNW